MKAASGEMIRALEAPECDGALERVGLPGTAFVVSEMRLWRRARRSDRCGFQISFPASQNIPQSLRESARFLPHFP